MNKLGLGPVVATSLLFIVAVIGIVGFQSWFNTFSTSTLSSVESQGSLSNVDVQTLIGSNLYVANTGTSNITLSSIKIGGVNCDLSTSILEPGINEIDVGTCLIQNTRGVQEVAIYTDNDVSSEKLAIKTENLETPYLTFSSNSSLIPYNSSVLLSWQSWNLDSCTASRNWSGAKSLSGSEVQSNLLENKTYTLTCDSLIRNVSINVYSYPAITFNAGSTDLAYNGSTTLTWSVSNADNCTGSGNWSGAKALSGSYDTGNLENGSYTYDLSCSGFAGTSQKNINITVLPPCTSGSQIYSTAQTTYLELPLGCTQILVKAWGAGGGGGGYYCGTCGGSGGNGGGGGFIQGNLTVASGANLTIIVGAGGGAQGMGGYSGVLNNGTPLFIAGGGGDGGYCQHNYFGGNGGGGGGLAGVDGSDGTYPGTAKGYGGNQTSGGLYGGYVDVFGGYLTSNGYYAGGGGWDVVNGAIGRCDGGGGGGSSYSDPSATDVTNTAGSGITPANTGDSDYVGSAGVGGGGRSGCGGCTGYSGNPGLVKIYWS